jgi:hypothetical protein
VIFHTFTSAVGFVSLRQWSAARKEPRISSAGCLVYWFINIQSEANHFGSSAGNGLLVVPDGASTRIGVPQMDFSCIHPAILTLKHPEICEVVHILRKFLDPLRSEAASKAEIPGAMLLNGYGWGCGTGRRTLAASLSSRRPS